MPEAQPPTRHLAPSHVAHHRRALPTQNPAGRAFRSASLPCPAGRSYCRSYLNRPIDAAYSGPAGFCVGPRYFPGVVRVQRLRQSAFVLRLGYIDPAESFAFPLPDCTSPTSKRAGYSFQPVSGFMLRNACNPPLATSGDQPGSVVVAPRRRFDVGPRLSGVSCHLSPSDLSRNRTAPLPTKPRQTSRNRTGTFFVGGRR